MRTADTRNFKRRDDGTLLQRRSDGSYAPVTSATDRARLDLLTEDEIERMGADDPDHPTLDDDFWASLGLAPTPKEAISIKLDGDILSFFRQQGRGYQTRINAVLRHYVDSAQRAKSDNRK